MKDRKEALPRSQEIAAPAAGRSAPLPERQVAFRFGLSAESRAAAYLIATDRQRARIIAAAEAYLARVADETIRDIRFDAVLVAPGRIPLHIPAAFDASR